MTPEEYCEQRGWSLTWTPPEAPHFKARCVLAVQDRRYSMEIDALVWQMGGDAIRRDVGWSLIHRHSERPLDT